MNDEQRQLWNGTAGAAWVEGQPLLDDMFRPFEALLVREAQGATRVLDIGCGTGSTSLAIARSLSGGTCLGVDVSAPMIARARERAAGVANVEFRCDDAGTHAFEPRAFDLLVSRFGVMFFADPVKAFANLLGAARARARLRAIAWRSTAENPFMTAAERAAAPLLPALPPRQPNAPGQFAFADANHVRSLLQQAGWGNVELERLDVECALPRAQLLPYLSKLGPVGQALRTADDVTRARVLEALGAAFAPFERADEVRYSAACWMVSAVAS